ncbi:rod shape-determining protein MreD [Hahella sp. CCB-MM4]|uniref:rod shape-determining protein MreD n=1 Tax=Hahella sp. (strain CCB-MM4) TaxID=1926491 RepID=UPI000B9A6C1F|nr:rod shape-determining protein MreD [Hahella sp. CCB-MM4]OZG70553.1 rod shape-determining protein MreD [Hahella sp. CCB-MM4]
MARDDPNYLLFVVSFILAFCLGVLPLSGIWVYLRPEMISLVMFYWTLRHPAHFGIIVAWVVGLFWDVLVGSALGVHALALGLQSYLVLTMIQRLQLYPALQQSFVVFIIVGIVMMLYRWIGGFISHPASDMTYMLAALTSAMLWPLVRMVLNRFDR